MANATNQWPRASLMGLPAELREQICIYVVVEPGAIEIDETPKIPGLLHTCTQLRAEAYGIYLNDNEFKFEVYDFDVSLYLRWCQAITRFDKDKVILDGCSSTNWANLLKWTKAAFHGECPWHSNWCEEYGAIVAGQAHDLAIRRKAAGETWESTAKDLECLHLAVASIDFDWN